MNTQELQEYLFTKVMTKEELLNLEYEPVEFVLKGQIYTFEDIFPYGLGLEMKQECEPEMQPTHA